MLEFLHALENGKQNLLLLPRATLETPNTGVVNGRKQESAGNSVGAFSSSSRSTVTLSDGSGECLEILNLLTVMLAVEFAVTAVSFVPSALVKFWVGLLRNETVFGFLLLV